MIYDGVINKPPMESLLCHFNPNHDPRNGQFITGSSITQKNSKGKVTICGSWEQAKNFIFKSDPKNDFVLKKGIKFLRLTHNPNEKFNIRMYVSKDGDGYNDMIYEPGKKIYLQQYQLKKDAKIAGKDAIQRGMSKVFNKKIDFDDRYNDNGDINEHSISMKYANFMFDNTYSKQRNKFINYMKKQGYDAILDPADSNIGFGYNPTAMIFFTNSLGNKKNVYSYNID